MPIFDIRLRSPEWSRHRRVTLVTGDRALRLNVAAKRLDLASGRTVEWERLLIATGSMPATVPIDGLAAAPVFTLYREDDVERLKPHCRPGAKALLVGFGLIGLQAASALNQLGVTVVAVEQMPKVLPLILDAAAARYAQRRLEEHGIEVHLGTSVRELRRARGAGPNYLALTDRREEIGFDFLVLATGMRPDLSLVTATGIESDRGIKVSAAMETSIPGVYAAGDITSYPDWIEGRSEIHAHWVNAYRQGRIAGLHMADEDAAPYEPVFLNALNVFDLPIIAMGASRIDAPAGAEVYVSETPARPAYTRLVVRRGRLIAATFVNAVERAGVFQYLMREKVDISNAVDTLLEQGREGMEFLDKLHENAVKGDIDWPASMDLIGRYRKDHKHTRWGQAQSADKQET